MSVSFSSQSLNFSLSNQLEVSDWISSTFSSEKISKKVVLSVIFCTDEELLEINRVFLNHDYYTDIITFPIEDSEDLLESELYISIDRVEDNASNNQVPFYNELSRVIIHGVLHLCGYGDKTTTEQKIMRQKENFYLSKLV